jgi:hypothetical protein
MLAVITEGKEGGGRGRGAGHKEIILFNLLVV